MDEADYNYIAKIIIIGNSNVGKTNIVHRYTQDKFIISHMSTIGMDYKIKTINIQGKKLRMTIWDTAGQQKFKTLTRQFYKGAAGIILVFSLTDKKSMDDIKNWMDQISKQASEDVVTIILGNKCDSQEKIISSEQVNKLKQMYNVSIFQTSAKQNININQAFDFLGKMIVQQQQKNCDQPNVIDLENDMNVQKENIQGKCKC